MLSRKPQSFDTITSINKLLFKSSAKVDSPIDEYSSEKMMEMFRLNENEVITNFNVKNDILFIETNNTLYFFDYALSNSETFSLVRPDIDTKPQQIDCSVFDAFNVLYNEQEHSYYSLCTKIYGTSLFLWLIKFDAFTKELHIVFDTCNPNPPKGYYYSADGDNWLNINDLIKDEIDHLDSTTNVYENLNHDVAIDPDTFEFTFSFNNKLRKYLVTYMLKDKDDNPKIYEHKFRLVNDSFIQESFITNIYSLKDKGQQDESSYSVDISITQDTSSWIEGDCKADTIGELTLYKDGKILSPQKNPYIFYVIYDETNWSFIKGSQVLDKSSVKFLWKTPTDENECVKLEWKTFLSKPAVYSIFFFVNADGATIQNQTKVSFVNTSFVKRAYIEALDPIPTATKGNYDEYTIKTPYNVWCVWNPEKEEEPETQTSITEYCTTQVNWYGEHLPEGEADCTFFGNVPYEYNISVEDTSIIGLPEVSPSENKSFSYPTHRVLVEDCITKTYYNDYYFLDFKANTKEGDKVLEENVPLDFHISDTNKAEKVIRPKNRIKIKYTDKPNDTVSITYYLDSFGYSSNAITHDEKIVRRPTFTNIEPTVKHFDPSTPDKVDMMIRWDYDCGDFEEEEKDDDEKEYIQYLFVDGKRYDITEANGSFVIPNLSTNVEHSGYFVFKSINPENNSFSFKTPIAPFSTSVGMGDLHYKLKYSYESDVKFYGNIDSSTYYSLTTTITNNNTKHLSI